MTQKSIVYIAVFGSFWGFAEATLGNALHLLNLPFSGSILSSIALIIILIARIYNPVRGSTLTMAFIAAFIKILSFSTVKMGPFFAIIAEGALIEIVLLMMGTRRIGFLLSGLVMAVYPLIQTIIVKSILFGASFVPIIIDLADGFSERIGFAAGWWLLGLYLFAQIMLPLCAAYLAWVLKNRINTTLELRNGE